MTIGDTGHGFADGELGVDMHDGRAAVCLRQQDAVGTAGDDGVEVGIGQPGRQPIDPHVKFWPARYALRLAQEGQRTRPCLGLAFGRDRILEIDDQGIGARAERLVELLRAVGRNEQQRAHRAYRGRMRMNAWRWHSATSLPC
jgi:hypothetical protein